MIKGAEVIVVLAKEPQPGRVKTRLQSLFSADEAAQLAAAAIRDTQQAVRASRVPRRVLCWDGNSSRFADGFEVLPQRSGTLNDRLAGAFDDLGRDGSARVLLIGMDTPQISAALLETDWDDCDAILGLSEDGGFWAIGLHTPDPARVFAGIEMSTARTGSAQLAQLLSLGRSVKLLPPLRDIDEPADAAYVADHFPDLEFSQLHAALVAVPRPDLILDQLYAGSPVQCDASEERVFRIDAARWSARADDIDQLVVSRCRRPVLDLGCGPGRMVQALNESGVPALGVDMSKVADRSPGRPMPAIAAEAFLADAKRMFKRPLGASCPGRPTAQPCSAWPGFVPARTCDSSELPTRGRIQRILNPTGVQLTINHSPPEGNLNLLVQCLARNAAGRQAARGVVLTIIDHQRQYESSYTEDLATCVRHLVDELGRGPVRWPPDPGYPVAWRDRLIGDHIGPLIQRDAVSRASAVQLSSLIGLIASKGGSQPWLEQLYPNLSGALSIGRRRSGLR
jgi:glycosyltransferase A (GT-A) superfamily protein (DUF2064 family)